MVASCSGRHADERYCVRRPGAHRPPTVANSARRTLVVSRVRWAALGLLVVCGLVPGAVAAQPVHVARAGKPAPAIAGRSWTLRLAVRPASFHGTLRVTASGPERTGVRATGGHGSYRARLVFPSAGRWKLAARAGATTSQLGSVRVRPAPPQPLAFSEPTSIFVEPSGTLLLVENSPGRLLRVDPRTGGVTALVPSISRPYAAVRAPSGDVFLSNGSLLSRVDATGARTTVATAGGDIGPVAVAPGGDVYYATATQVFRLAGAAGPPVLVAGTGVEGGGGDGGPAPSAQFSAPHGLAIAKDGAVLVSDAGNDRVRRIDPASGVVTALAQIGTPHGLDVAADGTIYVIDSRENRVVHLGADGSRLGLVGPVFGLPYAVASAPGGVVYVLESGPFGRLRRVAPDGTVTTVSRG
jgi:streptogramin lyase